MKLGQSKGVSASPDLPSDLSSSLPLIESLSEVSLEKEILVIFPIPMS